MMLMLLRDDEAVSDDIIHEGRTRCAGITKIVDLHRCYACGKYAGPGVFRMSVKINSYVDTLIAD